MSTDPYSRLWQLTIRPLSPWSTPWQADSLFGSLCWTAAAVYGDEFLRTSILEPALCGTPPFVLSDAFPTGWMPMPQHCRYAGQNTCTDGQVREKTLRKAKFIKAKTFWRLLYEPAAAINSASDLRCSDAGVIAGTLRNQVSRQAVTAVGRSQLFQPDAWALHPDDQTLSVFARIDPEFIQHLEILFNELSRTGFGADISTGKGEFEVCGNFAEVSLSLDRLVRRCVVISSFQPAQHDPTEGLWECFTKYGKLGASCSVANVFKRPIVMLRPGAVLHQPRLVVGRCISGDELLSADTQQTLAGMGIKPVHPAFGLALPF